MFLKQLLRLSIVSHDRFDRMGHQEAEKKSCVLRKIAHYYKFTRYAQNQPLKIFYEGIGLKY